MKNTSLAQLKNLFPEHKEIIEAINEKSNIWLQEEPIICKYEKRKGKPITILEGYNGSTEDFKILAKEIKTKSRSVDVPRSRL